MALPASLTVADEPPRLTRSRRQLVCATFLSAGPKRDPAAPLGALISKLGAQRRNQELSICGLIAAGYRNSAFDILSTMNSRRTLGV